jgi:hypothetical protein
MKSTDRPKLQRERRRETLRQEMAVLEEDQDDRREMLEVAEFMQQLRAGGVTSFSD